MLRNSVANSDSIVNTPPSVGISSVYDNVDTLRPVDTIDLSDPFPFPLPNSGFKKFTRSAPCPACGGHKKCSVTAKGVIHCRGKLTTVPAGFKELDESAIGFQRFAPINGAPSTPSWTRKRPSPLIEAKHLGSPNGKERDRQFRKVAFAAGIGTSARDNLTTRGVDDATINQWHDDRLVWSWSGDATITGTTGALPGIDPRTGRTRNLRGLTVAIPSVNGNVIGAQFRGDSWYWVSSEKVGGNGPRLQNGELPIGIYGPVTCTELNFAEGFLKPLIASDRHGLTVVGAAGGYFHTSPIQLQTTIKATGATRFVLNADGGAVDNPYVLAAYTRFYEWMTAHGYMLEVRWWGQSTKADGDVDEIDITTFQQARVISWGEFRTFWQVDTVESVGDELLGLKLGFDRIADVTGRIGYTTPKPILKPKAPVTTSAIVPYVAPNITPDAFGFAMPLAIATIPANIDDYVALGSPNVETDDMSGAVVTALKSGYRAIALNGHTGSGKSHVAGELAQEWGTIRENINGYELGRLHLVSATYRNAQTETIEAIPTSVSGADLEEIPGKFTPLGNPQLRRYTGAGAKIEGLCHEESNIQKINQRSEHTVDRGIKSDYCTKVCSRSPFECPYLQALMQQQIDNPVALRSHIANVRFSEDSTQDVLIIDEADRVLDAIHTSKTGNLSDISQELEALRREEDTRISTGYSHDMVDVMFGSTRFIEMNLYDTFRPVWDAIQQGLIDVATTSGSHGSTHASVMALLPTRDQLSELFWECVTKPLPGAPSGLWSEALDPWHFDVMWVLEVLHQVNNSSRWRSNLDDWDVRGLKITAGMLMSEINPEIIYRTGRIIIDYPRENITVNAAGDVTFTQINRTVRGTTRKAGAIILMDATGDLWSQARKLGIPVKHILKIRPPRPDCSNLTLNVVSGLGKTTINRATVNNDGTLKRNGDYDIQKRIEALVKEISDRGSGPLGIIDYKKFATSVTYNGIVNHIGYCFHDNRGSNEFQDCTQMVSVANPIANLGAQLTEYYMITGETFTLRDAPTIFWEWSHRKQVSELIQDVGRLRAHRRPTETLTHWFIGDVSNRQLDKIVAAHPGVTVNVIPVTDICMDAATKGTQTTFAVVEAMWGVITAGASPKIDEIATAISRGKARVSQIAKELISSGFKALKKSLILLYKAINSKTKLSDLMSMDPDELRAILKFLPAVASELEAESITPTEALETLDVLIGGMSDEQAVALLSRLPHTTLATLITALLPMLPADAVAWVLKDFIPKSLGPVPVPLPIAT